ncbi:MAG: hypothetical protein KatS3mg103_1324 [Phycisphaerales bacterium]|nr:MAG: hypothetical protein KatS3mg103_1324 [Phycisphaerales bacterium]
MRQPTPPQRAMPILATRCVSVRIVHAVRVAVLAAVLGLGAGDLAAGRPAGLDPQDTPGDDRPTRAIGQRQQQGGADLPIDPLAITGEGFGPVVLPAARDAVAVGEIRVAGQRAWAWRVPWPSDEAPATDRLLLEGDVRLVMGTLELHAQRMHAWVQDLPDGAGRQFFVLLEDASMPAGAPGVGIAGPLLPIEGRLAPDGRLGVSAIVLEQAPPPPGSAAWTAAAVARGILADRLRELVGVPSLTPVAPDGPAEQAQLDRVLALARARLGTAPVREPILPMRGSVSFSASRIEQLRLGDGQDGAPPYAVVLRGPVTIQFSDRPGGRYAQLTAQDAVIFHKAQLVGTPRLQADDVLGVYLEGEVVADVQRTRPGDGGTDHYRVRSPRVYYDLAGDQALLLEAVFRAQPVARPRPSTSARWRSASGRWASCRPPGRR